MNLGNIKIITTQDKIIQPDNHRTVALVESYSDLDQIRNLDPIQLGSILLPSYDATCAALDGDLNRFRALYYGQLSSRECDEFISLILMSAFLGNNVKIFIPASQIDDLPYTAILREYMANMYGYTVNIDVNGYYNQAFDAVLATKFLLYKFIDAETFFKIYPVGVALPQEVIAMLTFIYQPYYSYQIMPEFFIDKINAAHGILQTIYTRG